ncbi:PAS domain S-box protein [candidate division KSB1 bacterium]|nr:PAS domain S-box protein [candidate division KSB1 bacterium]
MIENAKILIVEDDLRSARAIQSDLERLGSKSAIVTSAEAAVANAASEKPDLLLLDVQLNREIDGKPVAETIHQQHGVPVIFLDAQLDQRTTRSPKAPFGTLRKPVRADELHSAIEFALYRHEMRKTILESEQNFKALVENANDGILIAISPEAHVYANQKASEITGYSTDELMATGIVALAPPREIENQLERFQKRFAGQNTAEQYETEIIRKDGKIIPIEVTGSRTVWHGKPALIAMIRDISSRKRLENELERQKAVMSTILNSIPAAISCRDLSGNVLFMSKILAENEIAAWDDSSPEPANANASVSLSGFSDVEREVLQTGKVKRKIIERGVTSEGNRWFETDKIPYIDSSGNVCGVINLSVDVTERKRVIEALQRRLIQEEVVVAISNRFINVAIDKVDHELESALETIGKFCSVDRLFFFAFSPDHDRFVHATEWFKSGLQERKKELSNAFLSSYNWLKHKLESDETIQFASLSEYPTDAHKEKACLAAKNIKSILLIPLFCGESLFGAIGSTSEFDERTWQQEEIRLLRLTGDMFVNVLMRRRTEEALRESERKYRELVSNSLVGIYIIQNQILVYCNPPLAHILGYNEPGELIGKHLSALIAPESLDLVKKELALRECGAKRSSNYEINGFRKDGTLIVAQVVGSQIMYNGKPAIQGAMIDITERKRAEMQIQQSLREKEVLLREIHHRVKNNLQVISSLLHLQSSHIGDQQVLRLFKESQSRIKSMALIHESLYGSKDLANVNFVDYLRKLVQYLQHSYMTDSAAVNIELDVKHVSLDINLAIPCGLIVNELVSNSLKYAFADGRSGAQMKTIW